MEPATTALALLRACSVKTQHQQAVYIKVHDRRLAKYFGTAECLDEIHLNQSNQCGILSSQCAAVGDAFAGDC